MPHVDPSEKPSFEIQLRSTGEMARRLDRQKEILDRVLAESDAAESTALVSLAHPFINSLGMRFVRVPGIHLWFSVWQTRVQDYAAYAEANPGVDMTWKDVEWNGYTQGPDHPVVNVSQKDALAFCAWLSRKEGNSYLYWLPTDHEWSMAVGIGHLEDPNASPQAKRDQIEGFPWGNEWPPPPGSGNFFGEEGIKFDYCLDGYRDDYVFTAPVGSFALEHHGIKDLSGNVDEWCGDNQLPHGYEYDCVVRGGSWASTGEDELCSSSRSDLYLPEDRNISLGFRCVLFKPL